MENIQPGDIYEEEKEIKIIHGRFIDKLPEFEEYKLNLMEWNEQIENKENENEIIKNMKRSCLVTGMPGAGKSFYLVKIVKGLKEPWICFTYTNKASQVLIKRGIESQTFDSYFNPKKTTLGHIQTLGKKYKHIFIDEFSMTPNRYFIYLNELKNKFPEIKFHIFGDPNQCNPIEGYGQKWYNYLNSPLIKNLVGNNIIKLKYKVAFGRYDKTLYDVVKYFLKNRKLRYM
jgi:hypothetical protein